MSTVHLIGEHISPRAGATLIAISQHPPFSDASPNSIVGAPPPRLVLVGGYDGTDYLADQYVISVEDASHRTASVVRVSAQDDGAVFAPRCSHAAVCVWRQSSQPFMIVWGGRSRLDSRRDGLVFDPAAKISWPLLFSGDVIPEARSGHVLVTLSDNERIFMWGGSQPSCEPWSTDAYLLEPDEELDEGGSDQFIYRWRRIQLTGDVPSECYNFAAAALVDSHTIVLCGGKNAAKSLNPNVFLIDTGE